MTETKDTKKEENKKTNSNAKKVKEDVKVKDNNKNSLIYYGDSNEVLPVGHYDFNDYIKNEEKNIMKNNIRFMVSGRSENVSPTLLKAIRELEEKSKDNSGLTFNIAFNYGGRAEIIDAVNKILKSGKEEISEEEFGKYLYNDLPDPELLIRTSGEMRISNFLLWQIAYSELYITDTLWPDFNEAELDKAIENFNNRDRRFGGVK